MKRTSLLLSIAIAGLAATATSAQPSTDFEVTGPFKVVMQEEPTLPNHTVYRPSSLAGLKTDSLPVLVWGNGACANSGNGFERYLAEIASHGFIVIANGPIDARPGGRPPRPVPGQAAPAFPPGGRPAGGPPGGPPPGGRPAGGPPPASSSVEQMLDGITWAQKADADGPYKGIIDTKHVAVAGQSCGGLQALIAAADPRVTTAVIFNSGVLRQQPGAAPGGPPVAPPGAPGAPPAGRGGPPGLSGLPTPDLAKLHTPMIYIIGGPTDIAYANANGDFDEIKTLPVFRADLDVGHNGTLWEPHGGKFAEVASAWLSWRLKGDAAAGRQFTGTDCGLCKTAEWKVRTKNMGAMPRA